MAEPDQKRVQRFFAALLIGAILGAGVGVYIRYFGLNPEAMSAKGTSETAPSGSSDDEDSSIEDSVAWDYARAYQEGNWERVLDLTPWAQERLALVRQSEGPEAEAREHDNLLAGFGTRSIVENQLQDSGIEDQYVFTPGAMLRFDSVDEGREDLEAPVARRTWLVVTYPAREKAPLDSESIPIRSVRVGINVSHEGQILKANVVGNLDIDWASIRYDWPDE